MTFEKAAEIEAATPITVGASNEELAAKFRAVSRSSDGKPEGTRESLARCARMLDEYAPDCFPANEQGQVYFARAMMESVADEIRAFLEQDDEPKRRRQFQIQSRHVGKFVPLNDDWDRAGGDAVCETCQLKLIEHPVCADGQLYVRCDGKLVKL